MASFSSRIARRARALFVVLAGGAALLASGESFAQAPPSPLPGCSVRGTVPMPKGTEIFDAASGGQLLGNFTGAITPVYLSQLPADPKAGRALVATSNGQGASMRVEGWVRPSDVPLFLVSDVSSVPGHVAIAKGARVAISRVSADGIEVEHTVSGTSGQVVRAKATCDVLSLTPPGLAEPTLGGRRYIAQGRPVDVYDTPGGRVVFTLGLTGDGVQGFRSSEVRGAFARVTSRTDLTLEGWVRLAELSSVPDGELRDRYVPPQAPNAIEVKLADAPTLGRAARESALRADADRTAKQIGAVEPGAEVLILATIQGWVSVVPKGIGVMAAPRKGFWMSATDLAK